MAQRKPTVLKSTPRKARPLTGRGALPNVENLKKLSPERLAGVLKRFNIEPDLKAIEKRANKAWEMLGDVLESGAQPDEALWTKIESRVETEMKQTLVQQVKAAIRLRQMARSQSTGATKFIWVTCQDSLVCDSCDPRHGKVKTMSQWEKQGLPGSGALVCSKSCRCELVPADV